MGQLLVKEKQVVVPGELLAEGMDFLPANGAYRDNDKVVAMQLGMVEVNGRLVKVIPLSGNYVPKANDTVIGRVTDISYSNWFVDIGYAYDAVLGMKDATSDYIERGAELSQYFGIGDIIVTKVTNVTKSKMIDLTMKGMGLRKLIGGRIITVSPVKVPRILGKKGTMISMIQKETDCRIVVGQNGRVWISGKEPKSELLAEQAIKMVDQFAHVSGLTDKVKEFLQKNR